MMHPHSRRAEGQALSEMLMVLAVLAPLFLLIPLLGKYIDLYQMTETASRYVAFEAVARDPLNGYLRDDQLSAELAARLFAASETPVHSIEAGTVANSAVNPLWVDHRAASLMADPTTPPFARTRVLTRDVFPLARPWWNDGFDLRGRNFVIGSATLSLRAFGLSLPADRTAITVPRRTALLVEDWSALDTEDLQHRVEHASALIYPAARVDPLLTIAGALPVVLTDSPLHFGPRDWEIVPCNRLAEGCHP